MRQLFEADDFASDNQPRDLGPAVPAQALQAGQHWPTLRAWQPTVLKAPQHRFDPGIPPRVISSGLDLQGLRACQHLAHLLERAHPSFVQVDHHRFDDRLAPPRRCPPAPPCASSAARQAHSALESRAWLQAHTSLDKTLWHQPAREPRDVCLTAVACASKPFDGRVWSVSNDCPALATRCLSS